MEIQTKFSQNTCKPSFHSRINPVKNFEISTEKGLLCVEELKIRKNTTKKKISELADFLATALFGDNAIRYRSNCSAQKRGIANEIETVISNDNGHSTILVARDKLGQIQAAIMTNPFLNAAGAVDTKTCYLADIAISKPYRKNKIGEILVNKSLESGKTVFTDIFLTSKNSATGFYEKMEFKRLDESNPKENIISKVIKQWRDDCPDEVTLMHRPLNDSSQRWTDRVYEQIRGMFVCAGV